jgi:uncharacterized protein YkwD
MQWRCGLRLICCAILFSSLTTWALPDPEIPPPVFYEPDEPVISASSQPELDEAVQVQRFAMQSANVSTALFGSGVSSWTEGAENGLTDVIDSTNAGYDLIQSDRVALGNYAFHLTSLDWDDNYFELDVSFDVQVDTQLFFQSQLQYATSGQIAKVQVSLDGGSTWPDTIYSQAGDNTSGEGSFTLRSVDLGASYANQQIRVRFYYDYTGGSAYHSSEAYVGWLIDDIQIGDEFEKVEWLIGDPSPDEVLYLEVLNRARADAMVEAARLGALTDSSVVFNYNNYGITPANIISQFQSLIDREIMTENAQPLAFNVLLMETATKHSEDMYQQEFQGHDSSTDPIAPFEAGDSFGTRLSRVGYAGGAGENVYAYAQSVEHGHAGFDVDWGGSVVDESSDNYTEAFEGQGMQNPAGHRINVHNGVRNEAGIGVVNGSNGSVGPQIVTQDLGTASGVSYITGLVYDDTDADGFYTVTNHTEHEGRGNVRIDVEGSAYYTTSTSSGAYAIPVTADGSYVVTFSGEGGEHFSTSIVIEDGMNTKFDLSGYALWAYDQALVGGPSDDDDLDGIANLVEYGVAGMAVDTADAATFPALLGNVDGSWGFTLGKRSGVTDLEYSVEVVLDLQDEWQSPNQVDGVSIVTDDASELELRIEAAVAQCFLRLKVTQNSN